MLPYINIPFVYVANKLGASPDELKLIFSFLLSYPLAGLLKRVPDTRPAYKNLFAISIGVFYLIGLLDLWSGLRTILISAIGTYTIAFGLRGSPYMPWLAFIFVMGHMSVSHIARQRANSPSSVDVTGAQMVLLMKLSAFAWNVADGTLPEEVLSDFQKDRRLPELPGLLDFLGYVFFFPSLLIGPAFDFAEYRRWLDCTMFDVPVTVDPAKKPPTRRKRRIPRSGTPAMVKLATGLGWIFVFLKLGEVYPPKMLLEEGFSSYGFLRRLWILHMVNFTARSKYYGVWTMTEGACILSGLGFNGVDPATGKVSWDRLVNISPVAVEFAQNCRGFLEGWNINANKWLRNYVYLRVTPRGKKPGFRASLATFTTSAFWHGFYPGYYLCFVLTSFIQTVAKDLRRYLRPFFLDPASQQPLPSKRYYDLLSIVVTQATFAFVTTPFLILSFSGSVKAWSRVYFYVVLGTAASMAFFASPAKPWLKSQLQQRAARAGVAPATTGGKKGGADGKGHGATDGVQMYAHDNASADSLRQPLLGMPSDPQQELDDAIEEIRAEIEDKRRLAGIEAERVRQRAKGKVA